MTFLYFINYINLLQIKIFKKIAMVLIFYIHFVISRVGLVVISLGLIVSLNSICYAEDKVIVYNFEDYFPKNILDDFTKETGINVEYLTFSRAEVMFGKLDILKGRGYDVVISSTSLVEKMYKKGLLRQIDTSLITNIQHLDQNMLDRAYDPKNKYSIPYLWGSAGIIVNSDKVDIEKITSWKNLWHKQWRNKLLLLDNMRSVFHMALRANGHATNSVNEEEVQQAYELLLELAPNIKFLAAKNISNAFNNKEVNLGSLWDGDAAHVKEKNGAVEYIYPAEGAFFWMDSFSIPVQAPHIKNAHLFINYMLRPDIAVRCVKELHYSTPNRKARELIDEKIRNNPIIFPPTALLEEATFPRDLGDKLDIYKRYWAKIKNKVSSN
jgi:spermidine/putrescine transport system substrate-binding protein